MDGVRHHQTYGNVITSSARTHHHPHHSSVRGESVTQQQQQQSSRHSTVAQHHHLQHSSSTVGGGGPGVGREVRETRRSISIPVIGDNRNLGGVLIFCSKYKTIYNSVNGFYSHQSNLFIQKRK